MKGRPPTPLMRRKTSHQFVRIVLVAVYAAQIAFAQASEISLWNDRRAGLQLAQLTLPPPIALRPSAVVAGLVPPSALAALTPAMGTVRGATRADAAGAPLVIHILDVHQNRDAQKHISEAVCALADGGASLLALEGAFGPVDFAAARTYEDRSSLDAAADHLLGTLRLSGPAHAALRTANANLVTVGIDDAAAYRDNVDAYLSASRARAQADAVLSVRRRAADEKARASLGDDARRFDDLLQARHDGRTAYGPYLAALAAQASAEGIEAGDETRRFLSALARERSLDFTRAESERARLVSDLSRSLAPGALSELMKRASDYRDGRISHGAFYAALSRAAGPALAKYPALSGYLRYVALYDRIDGAQLLVETDALEKQVAAAVAHSPAEAAALDARAAVRLAERLVAFELSPVEWKRAGALSVAAGLASGFGAFYAAAERRNGLMTSNFLRAMDAGHHRCAVLVTGGFHADDVDAALRRAGMSVVTFVPRVGEVERNGAAYLTIFAQEKSPLERLGEGERLFLAPPVWTPGKALLVRSTAALRTLFLTAGSLPRRRLVERAEALLGRPVRSVTLRGGRAEVEFAEGAAVSARFDDAGHFAGIDEQIRMGRFRALGRALAEFPQTVRLLLPGSEKYLRDFVARHGLEDPAAVVQRLAGAQSLRVLSTLGIAAGAALVGGTPLLLGAGVHAWLGALAGAVAGFLIAHVGGHAAFIRLFPESPLALPDGGTYWMPLPAVAFRSSRMRELPARAESPRGAVREDFAPRYGAFLDDPRLFARATRRWNASLRVDTSILNQGGSEYQGAIESVANAIDAVLQERGADAIGRFGNGFRTILAVLKLFPGPGSRVHVTTRVTGGPARRISFRSTNEFEVTWGRPRRSNSIPDGTRVDVVLDGDPAARAHYLDGLEAVLARAFAGNRNLPIVLRRRGQERIINPVGDLSRATNGRRIIDYGYPSARVEVEIHENGFSIIDRGVGIRDDILLERFFVPRSPNKDVQRARPFSVYFQARTTPPQEVRPSTVRVTKGGRTVFFLEGARGRNLPETFEIELPPDAWVTESWDRFELGLNGGSDVGAKDIVRAIVRGRASVEKKFQMLNAFALVLVRMREVASADVVHAAASELAPWLEELRGKGDVIAPSNKPGFFDLDRGGRPWHFLDPILLPDFVPEGLPGAEALVKFGPDGARFDALRGRDRFYLVDFNDPQTVSFDYNGLVFLSRGHFEPHAANPAPPELWERRGETTYEYRKAAVRRSFRASDDVVPGAAVPGRASLPVTTQTALLTAGQRSILSALMGRANEAVVEAFVARLSSFIAVLSGRPHSGDWFRALVSAVSRRPRSGGGAAAVPIARWPSVVGEKFITNGKDIYFIQVQDRPAIYAVTPGTQPRKIIDLPRGAVGAPVFFEGKLYFMLDRGGDPADRVQFYSVDVANPQLVRLKSNEPSALPPLLVVDGRVCANEGFINAFENGGWTTRIVAEEDEFFGAAGGQVWGIQAKRPYGVKIRHFTGLTRRPVEIDVTSSRLPAPGADQLGHVEVAVNGGALLALLDYGTTRKLMITAAARSQVINLPNGAGDLLVDDHHVYLRDFDAQDRALLYKIPFDAEALTLGEMETIEPSDARTISDLFTMEGRVYASVVTPAGATEVFAADELRSPAEGGPVRRDRDYTGIRQVRPTFDFNGERMFIGYRETGRRELELFTVSRGEISGNPLPRTRPTDPVDVITQGDQLSIAVTHEASDQTRLFRLNDQQDLDEIDVVEAHSTPGVLAASGDELLLISGTDVHHYGPGGLVGEMTKLPLPTGAHLLEVQRSNDRVFVHFRDRLGASSQVVELKDGQMDFAGALSIRSSPLRQLIAAGRDTFALSASGSSIFHRVAHTLEPVAFPPEFDNVLEIAAFGGDLFVIASLNGGPGQLYRAWVSADGIRLEAEPVSAGNPSEPSNIEALGGEIFFNGVYGGQRWHMRFRPSLRPTVLEERGGADRLVLTGTYGRAAPQAHSVEFNGARYALVYDAPGRWSMAVISAGGIELKALPLARDERYVDLAVWNGEVVVSAAGGGLLRAIYRFHNDTLEPIAQANVPPGDPFLVPGTNGLLAIGAEGAAMIEGASARVHDIGIGRRDVVSVHRTARETYAAMVDNGDLVMARLHDGRVVREGAYVVGELPSPRVVSFTIDDAAYVIADSGTDSDAPRGLFRLGDDMGVPVQVPQGRPMAVAAFHGRLYVAVRNGGGEEVLYSGNVRGTDADLTFEGTRVDLPAKLTDFEFDETGNELFVVAITADKEAQRFELTRSVDDGLHGDVVATVGDAVPAQPAVTVANALYTVVPGLEENLLISIKDGRASNEVHMPGLANMVSINGVPYWLEKFGTHWALRGGEAMGGAAVIARFGLTDNPRLITAGGRLFVALERDREQALVLDGNRLRAFDISDGASLMDVGFWDNRFYVATSFYGSAWVHQFDAAMGSTIESHNIGPVTLRSVVPLENQILVNDIHGNEEWGLQSIGRDGRTHSVRVPVDTNMTEMVSLGARLALIVDDELQVGELSGDQERQEIHLTHIPIEGHVAPRHLAADDDGLRFFARNTRTLKVDYVFMSWEKMAGAQAERGPPALGTLPAASLEERLPAFLASHAAFYAEYPALREQLLNRLYYERDPGWPLDERSLLVISMMPTGLMDQLDTDLLDRLARFAARRDAVTLRRFFAVADSVAPALPAGEAAGFFRRWIELFDTMADRTNGLKSLFETLESPDARLLLAQNGAVEDSQSANTELLLYVRFLRGDVAELLQEVADVHIGYSDDDVIDRLSSPVSLARVNLTHQELRNSDRDIARGAPRSVLETASNIHSFEAMVNGHASLKAEDQERTITSAIFGQDKSENVAARELVQNSRDAAPGQTIHVDSFLRPEAHEWVRRVSDSAGMELSTILGPLLVLDVSPKADTDAAGLFGQGFYTMFADYDRVRIKTGRGGRTFHLVIEKDAKGLPQIVDFVETDEAFKGTVIDWARDYDETSPPYLQGLLFAQDLIRYVGAVRDAPILYNGRRINETMDAEDFVDAQLVDTNGTPRVGTIGVRLTPGTTQKRVTQKDLFVMPVQEWMFELVPPKIQQLLLGRGFNIDIPGFIPITRTRTAIVNESLYRRAIQQAMFSACLRLAVQLYYTRNRLPPGLAEDFLWTLAVGKDDTPDAHLAREAIDDALLLDTGRPEDLQHVDFEAYHLRSGESEAISAAKADRLAGLLSVLHIVTNGERRSLWEERQELKRVTEAREESEKQSLLARLARRAGDGFVDRARQSLEDADTRLAGQEVPTLRLTPAEARRSPSFARLIDFYERMLAVVGSERGGVRVSVAYHPTDASSFYNRATNTIYIKLTGNLGVLSDLDRVLSSGSHREAFEFFVEHLDTALHELTHQSDRGTSTHEAFDIEKDERAELPYFAGEEHELPNIGGFGWRLKKLVGLYMQALGNGAWERVRADVLAAHPDRPTDLAELRLEIIARHARLPSIDAAPGAWARVWLGVENLLRWTAGRPPLRSLSSAQARWRFPLYGAAEGALALGLGWMTGDPLTAVVIWSLGNVVLHLWSGVFAVDAAGRLAPSSPINARGMGAVAVAVITGGAGIALVAASMPVTGALVAVGAHLAYNLLAALRVRSDLSLNPDIRARVVNRARAAGLAIAAARFENAALWPVGADGRVDRDAATWLVRADDTEAPGDYVSGARVSLAQLQARYDTNPRETILELSFVPELLALVEGIPFQTPDPSINENWGADWFRDQRRKPVRFEWTTDPLGGEERADETLYQVGVSRIVRNNQTGMERQNPRVITEDAAASGRPYIASERAMQKARQRGEIYARRVVEWLDAMGRTDLVGEPLLEIGAGGGFLLDRLRAAGWPAQNLAGVEEDASQVAIGRDQLGLGDILVQSDIASYSRPDGSVKVLLLVATLEHLDDPAAAIEKARRLLAPNGVLFVVDLPNVGGVLAEGGGSTFTHYAWDDHRQFFRYETLETLLGRAGFHIANDTGLGRAPFGKPGEPWWHPMSYVAARLGVRSRRSENGTLMELKAELRRLERSMVQRHGGDYALPAGLDDARTAAEFEVWWNLRVAGSARLGHDMTVMAIKRSAPSSPMVERALEMSRAFLAGHLNEDGVTRAEGPARAVAPADPFAVARARTVIAFASSEPFALPPVMNFGLAVAERPLDLSAIGVVDARMLESAVRASMGEAPRRLSEAQAQERLTPLFMEADVRPTLEHLGNRDLVFPVSASDRALTERLLEAMTERGGTSRLVLVGAAAASWRSELAGRFGTRVEFINGDVVRDDGERAVLRLDQLDAALAVLPAARRSNLLVALRVGMTMEEGTLAGSRARVLEDLKFILVDEMLRAVPIRFTSLETIARLARVIGRQA